jgi:hypothetical protein
MQYDIHVVINPNPVSTMTDGFLSASSTRNVAFYSCNNTIICNFLVSSMRSRKRGVISFVRLFLFLTVLVTIILNWHFYGAKVITKNDELERNPVIAHTESSTTALPVWMQDYFKWHALQSPDNSLVEYLVVRCLNQDTHCGGTADRLMPLPLFVMMAARMKRVLLFHWERPCSLEEFLVPSTDIDWRIPKDHELFQSLDWKSTVRISHQLNVLQILDPDFEPLTRRRSKPLPVVLPRVVTTAYQSQLHGADLYDQFRNRTELFQWKDATQGRTALHQNEPSFERVYSALWKAFFQPSPRVQSKIDAALRDMHLMPNDYVAAHIRALYQQEAGPKKTAFVARNAMHCASQFLSYKGQPIYVVSDSVSSTKMAMQYVHEQHSEEAVVVVTRPVTSVLHLDRGTAFLVKDADQWTKNEFCADYDDTFVDLYLLILAKCRTVHLGSFAKWAHLIHGGNCINSHFQRQCRWNSVLDTKPG